MDKLLQQDAAKRDNKTIYDMIAYLSGRSLPGIPLAAPIPNELRERVQQFYWQHQVLITFLK